MKVKRIFWILILLTIIIILKYYFSEYQITYKINNYKITEKYINKKLIFEINGDNYFVIDLYKSRHFKKKLITKINKYEKEDYVCYKVLIKNNEEKLNCFKNNESISSYLIDNNELLNMLGINKFEFNTENENFKFYESLDKDTYIALWNYKGFYIMNNNEMTEFNLFKNTRYDNSLAFQFKENLILPNYDREHEFNEFKKINLKTSKIESIKSEYTFDYDSYISGTNNKSIFMFDNKYFKLYEINIKKNKITEVGNQIDGYIKIENNKKVKATKKEYKNKITYFKKEKSNYLLDDALYKIYDKKYKEKIFDSNEIKILKEYKNNLYFLHKEDLYLYDGSKIIKILHYFEFNFNSNDMIYIFINN